MASSLAHEIRNPLNTIRINLQLLEEELNQDSNSTKRRLNTINKEIDRLESILTGFLRFVRIPKPDIKKRSLYILLNELLDFTEPEAQQLNIEIIRNFNSDLPEIDMDDNQIKQALLNIILNANQAMPSGGKIIVKAYKTNNHVSIDITDTGEGVSPDRIDKLFNLFYSTKEDGTGLGLPIAKRIIDMHNGEIKVKSKLGGGTTFSVILPIHV
ncbi:MAG: sensor histidine kinase [bacterium]